MITSRVNMPARNLSLSDDPSIEAAGPINRRYADGFRPRDPLNHQSNWYADDVAITLIRVQNIIADREQSSYVVDSSVEANFEEWRSWKNEVSLFVSY